MSEIDVIQISTWLIVFFPTFLVFYSPVCLHDNSFAILRSQCECHLRKLTPNHLSEVSLLVFCHIILHYELHGAYKPNYLVYIFVKFFFPLQKNSNMVRFDTYIPTMGNSAWHRAGAPPPPTHTQPIKEAYKSVPNSKIWPSLGAGGIKLYTWLLQTVIWSNY